MKLVQYNECPFSTVDADGLGISSHSAENVAAPSFPVVYGLYGYLVDCQTDWAGAEKNPDTLTTLQQ